MWVQWSFSRRCLNDRFTGHATCGTISGHSSVCLAADMFVCVCVCVCVSVRKREGRREREKDRERECVCVCVRYSVAPIDQGCSTESVTSHLPHHTHTPTHTHYNPHNT